MTTKLNRRQFTTLLGSSALCAPGIVRAQSAQMRQFEGTTLNMLAVQFAHHDALWSQAAEFEELTGIKLNIEFAPFENARERTLLDMSSRSGRYDVFTVDIMWLAEYAAAGYLEPISQYLGNSDLTAEDYDVNDFVARVYSGTGVYSDRMYSVPYDCGTVGNMFRADLMEEAGISVPNRFDGSFTANAMREICGTLMENNQGLVGYVTGPQRWFWGWMFTPYLYAWQDQANVGNEFVNADWEVTINSENNLAALEYYLGLRDFTPSDDLNYGYGEQLAVYQQGNAAGSITYSGFIGAHYEDPSLPVAGRNVALHTPVGPSGRTDPFFGSWGLAMSVDSRQKEAAWFFIQWITHKERLAKGAIGGGTAVRHSTYRNPDFQSVAPWHAEMYDYMTKTANPDERIRVPEWAEISEVMGLYGNRAWGGEITAEQALEGMERDMKAAFRRGGYYRDGANKPPQLWRDLSYYDRAPADWE
ncbi:extracellular solute-binding protein [Marinovum sp. 2_MG-2023]|uniref:ABC transporter substrate-binding protein n=1 Tax=unclassified Marinovum TaxID=2647166 RepID=UPI0026E2CEC2|nr:MULTISPECIES: extracellular solute-binding protein [unclassified Marinovum]MDO6732759.1 extracellular solute-binding protein [Marinovum sp. 2_MG-2023]MDO6782033.1 extracellular solute-binding protein [Marinovum sp. 1_MG-2023]